MAIDLTGTLQLELEEVLKEAKTLRDAGESAAAARAYLRASVLFRSLADYALDRETRSARLLRSKQCHRQAALLVDGGAEAGFPQAALAGAPSGERPGPFQDDADSIAEAPLAMISRASVAWDDIGGLAETKRQLFRAVRMAFAEGPPGVELPARRGILLFGPPGTGKTLLAAAVSNALEATFFNVKVGDVLSKYFGESSKLISSLYRKAVEMGPSVVFLDECDALGGSRESSDSGAERRTLTSLLTEIDGLDGKDARSRVLTMGATNEPWRLDPALLSRLALRILIPLPDAEARLEILRIHLEKRGYPTEFALSRLVSGTEGRSGRDLKELCDSAVEIMLDEQNPGAFELPAASARAGRFKVGIRALKWGDFSEPLRRSRTPSLEAGRKFETWAASI